MSEPQLPREVRRRLAIIQHAEEVTGNVAMTCRYYGISRQVYYRWLRRYQDQGIDGLRDLSRRPRPGRRVIAGPDRLPATGDDHRGVVTPIGSRRCAAPVITSASAPGRTPASG
jgi:Winged helix-turn helix